MTTDYDTPPEKFACLRCGYVYNPEKGDPDQGLPPGTLLEDAPESWHCPRCGGPQKDFARKE